MVSKGGDITWTNQEQPNNKSEAPGDKTWHGLRTVVLEKGPGGFGFTLRHFVVYPPDTVNAARLAGKHPTVVDPSWDQHKQEAMDTIFVREVRPGSAADRAGLVTGDRIVSINGQPVTGRSYGQVIELIHKCGPSLQLLVVPKEDDILQLYFASSAYQPVRRLPQPLWSAETTRAESSPLRTTLANTSALSRCGASEPTSPVHCLAGTHFRPVNPARRLFFGLDPEPATTATTTAPTIEGTAFGLTSQPMSLSYPSYGGNNASTNASSNDPRRGAAGIKMPPSTSVPTCLGGQTRFAQRSDDGWHGQTDSGIGSVEEGEPKQTAAVTTTTTTMSTAVQHHQTALPEQSSLNLVAQRLHLFESGGLLARSLERMKLYRSELARLTSGCPVPIVSVRAARFEEMDGEGRKETASETSSLSVGGAYDRLLPLSSPTSRVPSFDRSPDSPLREERPFASLPDQSTLSGYADGADDVGLEEGGAYQTDGYISVTSDDASAVVYRRKNGSKEDKAHPARRTSYLRATANERLHLESDHSEDEQHSISSTSSTPSGSHRIQKLKAFFGDKASSAPSQASEVKNGTTEDPEITGDVQGWLACKTVLVDGKRSSDRSWRPVWLVLRGDKVYILKDRKTIDFGEGSHLSLRTSMSDVARDYTKRKHVFRLRMESGTEYLFQADNHSNMIQWVEALRQITNEDSEVEDILSDRSVLEKAAAFEQGSSAGQGRLSPMPVVRPVKKLAFRHRSPNSGSPRVKSRRASLGDEPSLKAVHMWRGKVVHSWKRLHGSLASLPPKGHSIGVPLHECPPSLDNQYVPWLVSLCTRVVEAKGLETVGVYRIPGNSAAVAALSAAANGGLDQLDLGDPRWGDVHVVSSLLKAFFRQLPDPLAGRYARFIAAARGTQGAQRLAALRALVHELPIHNFETLKFLMQHLKKVVAHSTTNKMEARNLAIVFGPTLVRTADNSMLTMITDMSHQCHITEALINYADYVFGDLEGEDGLSSVPELPLDVAALPLSDTDSSVLIDNLHKVGTGGQGSGQEVCTRDLVSSLVSAANRKLRQRKMSLTTEGAVLKPGSRVKDKIMAFEGKGGEEGPKAASPTGNGSVLVAMALPEGATSCSYPPSPTRTLGSPPQTPSVCSEDLTVSSLASGSASPRTYGQLSALAQQKGRFLEAETRAQLRASQRSWPPPQGCPSGQEGAHKREQIERDWQRAKQELEQDDLLDFLADDPSAFLLSHLGQQGTLPMLPPAPTGLSGPANPTPGSTSSTSSPANNAGEAFAASPRRGDTPPPCAAANPENPPKAPSRAPTSRHEKENIPQAGPASSCEPAPVTYRCKKHCLNGASRYAIYRVDDDAEALRQQQRRSENGVVAAVLSGDGVVLAAAATTTTTRRRPLSSMGLQRRHTIGSSRDVKFHPFPTPTSSSFRRVPSGQRLDEGEAWKRLGGARVASPV
uniref:Putative rho gtpase-activating protein 21 isoform x3 n=1 Tax=Ixodes ricinus TaxID=34613 RepID=A0A147BSQ5_IXORI